MKRLLAFLILLTTCITHQNSFAQSHSTFDLKRIINLDNKDTDTQIITLEVYEKTSNLGLQINCQVGSGNLKVEIYDPKGVKQGEFAVESQIELKSSDEITEHYKKETVEGQIEKNINNPMVGTWQVKLIPEKTLAKIMITTRFITEE